MSQLEIGGECSAVIDEIKNDANKTNWVVFGYDGRSNRLKVEEKGEGGLEEFVEELNDGRIQFGYLRFAVNQTSKYLYVSWCGGGVEGMRKGLFNNHSKEFENWLGKPGRGFHLQINARTEDDLREEDVLEKLNKVSSFLKATSIKGGGTGAAEKDKEQLKTASTQYWQKEKQQDAARKEALSVHDKEKNQNLQAAKEAEQRRLEQQAKQTISSMEQQRQQDAQAFREKEAERTVVQNKLQEEKKAQIFGEQNRTRAAYTPADSSASAPSSNAAPSQASAARAAFANRPAPAVPAPAPTPAAKKAPGRLATPAAFNASANAPPPAKPAPAPRKAAPFKPAPAPAPAPAPVAAAKPPPPAVRKPAPPPPVPEPEPEPVYQPEPVYEEPPAPEPVYEEPPAPEPAYEEPAPVAEPEPQQYYEEPQQTYEEPQQAYEEPQQTYEEPQQTYEEQQTYDEQQYAEPAAEGYDQGQQYEEGAYAYVQAKALYDYAAEAETDLSFYEGDIINILDDQDPSGWWKGELNGVEGYFPSNFVEKIN